MNEIREAKKRERKLKRAARLAGKDQRKAERKRRLRELRCFWTWPFRHAWYFEDDELVCVGCGRKWDYDADEALVNTGSTSNMFRSK